LLPPPLVSVWQRSGLLFGTHSYGALDGKTRDSLFFSQRRGLFVFSPGCLLHRHPASVMVPFCGLQFAFSRSKGGGSGFMYTGGGLRCRCWLCWFVFVIPSKISPLCRVFCFFTGFSEKGMRGVGGPPPHPPGGAKKGGGWGSWGTGGRGVQRSLLPPPLRRFLFPSPFFFPRHTHFIDFARVWFPPA